MLNQPLGTHDFLSASASEAVLSAQATNLGRSPFSPMLQQDAESAFVDYFERQPCDQVMQEGARMFECARRDARLAPPVRHVLLQTLDRSLSRVALGYGTAGGPLCKLAALDAWQATVSARVLDAMGRTESGSPPVPLSASEQVLERKQRALLSRVLPGHIAALERLRAGSGMGQACRDPRARVASHDAAQTWLARFLQHLRRILFFTLDATLSARDVDNLLAFLVTPAGSACLAARTALGAWDASAPKSVAAPDPPEMTQLQDAMAEMIDESAGTDPTERTAYYMELAERMSERLHAVF